MEKKMKIVIASNNQATDSYLAEQFARARYFVVFESADKVEPIKNPVKKEKKGAGIVSAQIVADQKPTAVITNSIGGNAIQILKTNGIKIYKANTELTVKKAVDQLKKGELDEINE